MADQLPTVKGGVVGKNINTYKHTDITNIDTHV